MLKAALNALTRLHSRPGQLRRPGGSGGPDMYSPCRLTPSNYFRFLKGPDTTVIHGREFVIPIDSMTGQFAQTIGFDEVPASGTFKLTYNSFATTALAFNATASDIQIAIRLVTGLSAALVTGSISAGLVVTFPGFSAQPLIIVPSEYSTLEDSDGANITITTTQTYQAWTNLLKRGDKIIDSVFGSLTIDEIIEMVDLGGAVMAFRVHAE